MTLDTRRDFLGRTALGCAVAAFSSGAARAMIFAGEAPLPLAEAAAEAWLYGLPMIEMAQSRADAVGDGLLNVVGHGRTLTTPDNQSVTTPNNDTLYSRAWLDLSDGPVTVTLPRAGDRYLSVAFMDMFTNNFAILGTRTTGGDGGRFTIVGPGQPGSGPKVLRAPTPSVWMLQRLFVRDTQDLPEALAMQEGLRVEGPEVRLPQRPYASRQAGWRPFFGSLARLLSENPPPPTDDRLFDRIARLGLTPQGGFDPERFGTREAAEIERGIELAKDRLRTAGRQGKIVGGWVYPKFSLGDFGQDYLYRAQVALYGLAALPRTEAMYLRPVDDHGDVFFPSDRSYRLHFEAGALPPVDAFWSLTNYAVTRSGPLRLFANPISRYAISDRTPGLRHDRDGALTLWLSRKDPGPDRRSNWLPLPQGGPFAPILRAYLPQAPLIEGTYRLPPLEPWT